MKLNEWHSLCFMQSRDYYLIGNGQVSGVIQADRSGPGSPVTFLLQDPHYFVPGQKKDSSYLFDEETGLETSVMRVAVDDRSFAPVRTNVTVEWRQTDFQAPPIVDVIWWAGALRIKESYYAATDLPVIYRMIEIENKGEYACDVHTLAEFTPNRKLFGAIQSDERIPLQSSSGGKGRVGMMQITAHFRNEMHPHPTRPLVFAYEQLKPGQIVRAGYGYIFSPNSDFSETMYQQLVDEDAHAQRLAVEQLRKNAAQFVSEDAAYNHVFNSAVRGLMMCASDQGRVNVGIWEYNAEWVRDCSLTALGALHCGLFDVADRILRRAIEVLVDDRGRTLIGDLYVEDKHEQFDQAGQLLMALSQYVLWTGEASLIRLHWDKIKVLANRLCQSTHRDPNSSMFHNYREFWERDDRYGVEEGYELAYQMWPVLGLRSSGVLATAMGTTEARILSEYWIAEATKIWNAALYHPTYSFVVEDKLVKRKRMDGTVQYTMHPQIRFPEDIPLSNERLSFMNPDSVVSLPIAYGLVDANSTVAINTMDEMEKLWNLRWDQGGYDRYHTSSQPDTPGPWSFASMFVARANHRLGRYDRSLKTIHWFASTQGGKSGAWHEYVPIIESNAANNGLLSWVWAEMAIFFVKDVLGVEPLMDGIMIHPKVPKELGEIRAKIPVRGKVLEMILHGGQPQKDLVRLGDGEWFHYSDLGNKLKF